MKCAGRSRSAYRELVPNLRREDEEMEKRLVVRPKRKERKSFLAAWMLWLSKEQLAD